MALDRKRLAFVLGIPAAILCIPLIAMQFTDEVKWDVLDFVIAAVLLIGFSFLIDFAIRKLKENRYRILIICSILLLLVLLWMELAVGIFGTPLAGS